jgi:lipoprotein YgeR
MASLALLLSLVVHVPVLPAQETVHRVQPGETLYALSRQYGIPPETLQEYNGIADPRRISVGQEIRIPQTYTVQTGDNPYRIGLRFDIEWRELLRVNGLTEQSIIRPGDVLLLPSGAGAGTAPEGALAADTRAADSGEDATVTEHGSSTAGRTYDWPHPGVREQRDGKFPGVSIVAEEGDPIYAVARGTVFQVVPHSSFGVVVMIRGTGGYVYVYGGSSHVAVAAGDDVTAGTLIGRVGFSSAFQSARAFFTVYRDYRYVDPNVAPRG